MARFRRQKAANAEEDAHVVRKLGRLETFQAAQHSLKLYCGCAVSCRYKVPDDLPAPGVAGASLQSVVENAFARAILEHPLLTVGMKDADARNPSWLRLEHINLRNQLEWRIVDETEDYESVLNGLLEWQVNHYFTHLESRPHWRSVILRPSNTNFIDVVFAWNHTLGDGKSGKIFHDSLLKCLNSGRSEDEPLVSEDRIFKVPVAPFTPAVEELLKFPTSGGFVLSEALRTLKPSSQTSKSPYSATWARVQSEPLTTRVTSITLDRGQLQGILQACRLRKTTLTGIVHAITLVSVAKRLPKEQARAFQSGTPVCMRRFYDPVLSEHSNVDMEKMITNSVLYWPYKYDEALVAKIRQRTEATTAEADSDTGLEKIMWSVASTLRQELSRKVQQGTKNDVIGLMKFVGDWRAFLKKGSATREYSWEVSNLGVISGETSENDKRSGGERDWGIERATFTQSAAVGGPALTLNLLAVKGGVLDITCSWQEEVVDEGLVLGLMQELEEWLKKLGTSET